MCDDMTGFHVEYKTPTDDDEWTMCDIHPTATLVPNRPFYKCIIPSYRLYCAYRRSHNPYSIQKFSQQQKILEFTDIMTVH
jgi:hypothetical protein